MEKFMIQRHKDSRTKRSTTPGSHKESRHRLSENLGYIYPLPSSRSMGDSSDLIKFTRMHRCKRNFHHKVRQFFTIIQFKIYYTWHFSVVLHMEWNEQETFLGMGNRTTQSSLTSASISNQIQRVVLKVTASWQTAATELNQWIIQTL